MIAPAVRRVERPRPVARAGSAVHPLLRGALYLFFASIPFEMPQRSIPVEVPTLTGCILLLAALLQPSIAFRKIPSAVIAFGAFLIVAIASAVLNGMQHAPDLFTLVAELTQLVLLMWVIFNLFADERALRGTLLVFAAACVARAAIQLLGIAVTRLPVYASFTASSPSAYRVTTFGQNPNLSAMIFAAGIVVLLGLDLPGGARLHRLRVVTWPLAALLAVAIVQGGSRGGLLCALVGIATFALRGRTPLHRVRNALVASIAVVLLGWGALQSHVMRERLTQSEEGELSGRGRIYTLLWHMLRERPLVGWGLVANEYELGRRLDDPRYVSRDAHNLFLDLFTSVGLLGAMPFLIGLGLAVRGAWHARAGPLGLLPLGVLLAVLTGTLSGTWIASKILWIALTLALAAGAHWASRPELGTA